MIFWGAPDAAILLAFVLHILVILPVIGDDLVSPLALLGGHEPGYVFTSEGCGDFVSAAMAEIVKTEHLFEESR